MKEALDELPHLADVLIGLSNHGFPSPRVEESSWQHRWVFWDHINVGMDKINKNIVISYVPRNAAYVKTVAFCNPEKAIIRMLKM